MTQVNVQDAANQLPDLVARARAGEEIVLLEHGQPVVRLVPADVGDREQVHGLFKGRGRVADDFTAPLSDEELRKDWGT